MGKANAKYKINNWKQYNQVLVNRDSVTFLGDVAAIKAWSCPKHHGYSGRGFIFSDAAMKMALMVKDIFKLPLRGLVGFLNSIFTLMNVPLKLPTYTHISNVFENRKS